MGKNLMINGKKTNKSVLVTMADEKKITAAKQLFSSAYHNGHWKGDFVLLAHNVNSTKLKWFKDKQISIVNCKTIMNKIGGKTGVHLSKFYLFTKYYKNWDNVVYLDTDIIVKSSLHQLGKVSGFWAARDIDDQLLHHQFNLSGPKTIDLFESLTKKMEIDIDKPSFNAGVLAFSTNLIQKNTFYHLVKLAKSFDKVCNYADQTILNLYFYDKWKKLLRVYNTQPQIYLNFYKVSFNKLKPMILHFAGAKYQFEKPWDTRCIYYNEWKDNLDKANDIGNTSNNITFSALVYKLISTHLVERYLYLKRLKHYLKILNY